MGELTEKSWIKIVPQAVPMDFMKFHKIWKSRPTKQHSVIIFGKRYPVPRIQVMYGHSYSFSGNILEPEKGETPQYIQTLFDYVRGDCPNFDWNGALVNFYKDGNNYIGAHSDDEKDLCKGSPIYSFSYGGTRTFRIKPKKADRVDWDKRDIPTKNGLLVVMGGDFQKEFTHEIVKTKKKVGARINVTIRSFKK